MANLNDLTALEQEWYNEALGQLDDVDLSDLGAILSVALTT